MKKLLSLGLIGVLSASLMVGCGDGNTIKEKEVSKEEAQEIKEQQQNEQEQPKEDKEEKEENKSTSKTKQSSKNSSSENKSDEYSYVTCPNCSKKIKVNEYGKGTCNNCGLDYFPGCIKKGTELDEDEEPEEHPDSYYENDTDVCPECGLPSDECICDGDCDDDMNYNDTTIYDDDDVVPDEFKDEPEVHYYGIDGKEQTEDDWYRQNEYMKNGYNGHIDDEGNAYWTDEEGNEYR